MSSTSTRNWLELPSDLTLNILQRVGVIDRLENAQKVCTAWREICKDPAMWRVIHMRRVFCDNERLLLQETFKQAVDRSQGQLVELTINGFCSLKLLHYAADRSGQLRHLKIVHCSVEEHGILGEALKNLSLPEKLSLVALKISKEDIEAAGRYCPLLRTLKLHQTTFSFWDGNDNEVALAIGKNLPELTHLELILHFMNNSGLQAILDGCCHLESLDLRQCGRVDLKGDLGKRCSQLIKYLKLPHERYRNTLLA